MIGSFHGISPRYSLRTTPLTPVLACYQQIFFPKHGYEQVPGMGDSESSRSDQDLGVDRAQDARRSSAYLLIRLRTRNKGLATAQTGSSLYIRSNALNLKTFFCRRMILSALLPSAVTDGEVTTRAFGMTPASPWTHSKIMPAALTAFREVA